MDPIYIYRPNSKTNLTHDEYWAVAGYMCTVLFLLKYLVVIL